MVAIVREVEATAAAKVVTEVDSPMEAAVSLFFDMKMSTRTRGHSRADHQTKDILVVVAMAEVTNSKEAAVGSKCRWG